VGVDISLRDRFGAWSRGADLSHLGADLRLQPRLHALPVVVRRRDPNELTTSEAKALIDEIAAMQIFYINIGGGEPMMRRDFFELIEHAVDQHVGVKFSTNGTRIDEAAALRLASIDYLDIQISIDGVDAATSDRIRGAGSYDQARRAMDQPQGGRLRSVQDLGRDDERVH